MKKIISLLIFYFLFVSYAHAGFDFVGTIKSFNLELNHVEFILSNAKLNVYVIDQNIIRFRYTNQNDFSPAPSYALIYQQPEKI